MIEDRAALYRGNDAGRQADGERQQHGKEGQFQRGWLHALT